MIVPGGLYFLLVKTEVKTLFRHKGQTIENNPLPSIAIIYQFLCPLKYLYKPKIENSQ